ncbi:hypothetical protein M8J77_020456 [Diaphorina citri]|nr:hypothetical protein M8J77_020456 [Diaphorina citri]
MSVVRAYAVPRITGPLASNLRFKQQIQEQFPDVDFAVDTGSDKPADLLIGSDFYYSFVTGQIRHIRDNLCLVQSKLGWIVSGQPSDHCPNQILSFLTYVSGGENSSSQFTIPDPPLNDDNIRELWDLEAIGIRDSPKTLQQEEVIEFFRKTTVFEDGRYHVKWPWVQFPADLPVGMGLAIGRLTSLFKRLDPATRTQYDQVLKDQLRLGVIEVVDNPEEFPLHPVHYLPHHCVLQEDKTTKLRVVYDASAKPKGHHSLNDYLYKGPRMLDDLVKFLILFREKRIGIVADIEKAFLQVGLQSEDRDVTRFVWLRDINGVVEPDNIIHLRFKRVPFGIVSSPFLLTATIKHHLSQINTVEAITIANSLYVDNLILSVDSLEEGRSIFETASSSFNELSMNIREWNSSCNELMTSIPDNKQCQKSVLSVLGLEWNVKNDTLGIATNIDLFDKPVKTKRDILRIVASIFDPCGFISPFTLPSRILLQNLWQDRCKWDAPLPQNRLEEWERSVVIMKRVKSVKIHRFFLQPSTNQVNIQLHCFTDASKDAYAAVVYFRMSSEEGSCSVSFVMSRTRLTPLRQRDKVTIPKLELLGVFIGVKLTSYIKETLQLKNIQTFLWTDSQIVIGWIRSDRLLPPFVARRIAEIKRASHIQVRYVPTNLNPADVATRVLASDKLVTLWTAGPDFLVLPEGDWPVWSQNVEDVSSGCKPISDTSENVCYSVSETRAAPPIDEELLATEYDLVMDSETTEPEVGTTESEAIEPDTIKESESLTVDLDIGDGNLKDVKGLQERYFPRETSGLSTDLSRSLRLFRDSSGILRCNAKLQNADLPYDQKYPILLPRDSDVTQKIIEELHTDNHHVGVTHTLALLRKKYWVPMGRTQVAKVLRKCKPCVKYGGGPFKLPEMPPLPKERVAVCPPFSYTGLDYLGPLTIVEQGSRQKRWCVLFTCMASRAIHLELVPDMTTEEFILCLRRFTAARGCPVVIVSDNALQFKLSADVLGSSFCEKEKIQWRFIPALSPWQGGFYERLVGLVKHCLRRTLDKTLLNNNQLITVIKEIESVLNTRPLTCVGSELEHVLSPSDFLNPVTPIVLQPDADLSSASARTATKSALVSSWRKSQIAFDQFRRMFVDQYLTSLSERSLKPHKQTRVLSKKDPSVGDNVQVKENGVGRALWRVGRISELISSRDGRTRTARIKMSNGNEITRSISHLYPLEMDDDPALNEPQVAHKTSESGLQTVSDGDELVQDIPVEVITAEAESTEARRIATPESLPVEIGRPRRKAAEIARERILRLTENLLVLSKRSSLENF